MQKVLFDGVFTNTKRKTIETIESDDDIFKNDFIIIDGYIIASVMELKKNLPLTATQRIFQYHLDYAKKDQDILMRCCFYKLNYQCKIGKL